ncbi:MAG: Tetracycline resistance protein, class B [Actinobacteria bacterium ADurb.BinA094]|nr:MAG: Tetracycline resistance protein, class B [Actinobacteria bacterium ADurb.BinA094]
MQLGVVSVSEFIVWAGFGAIIPYLPLFLEEQAHTSMSLWAVIAAMFYVGTLLFSSPLGWLSDVIGRKPVMVGGAALYTTSLLLFTSTLNPYWFILFRLLEGIGTAAFGPAAQSFVADITTEKNRSKAYGFLTTAQFGGLIVGPALAAPLYHLGGEGTSGFYAIFYFGAILAAVSLTAVILLVKEPAALKTRRVQRLQDRRTRESTRATIRRYRNVFTLPILAFILIAFTSHYAMGAWDVVWSLYLAHHGASKTYISMTWIAFAAPMLFSFAGGMLADRYSRFWLLAVGFGLSSFAWMFYGLSTNLVALLVVNVLEGFAIAFSYPAKQAFLIQVSPPRWFGMVTGVESTSMQLAGLLGSLTAPLMYAHISGRVFTLAGLLSLAGVLVAAPVLYKAWNRLKETGGLPDQAELERLADGARPVLAAEPPHGPD